MASAVDLACSPTTFHHAVQRIFDSWTALQLAVQHGFGGQDSFAKAQWLVNAVLQWFEENSKLQIYEVEEFLAEILNAEFDTITEDGSTRQVAGLICECYHLCQTRNHDALRETLSKLPTPNDAKNVVQRSQGKIEEEEDSDSDMDVAESTDSPAQSGLAGDCNQAIQNDSAPAIREDSPAGTGEDPIEDDEWTTVSRSHHKKR